MNKKTVSVIVLTLLLMNVLMVTLDAKTALASPKAAIVVDPSTSVANPSEYFSVNVTITNVVDLFSYQVRIGFDRDILKAVSVIEGPFLQEGTTSPSGTIFTYKIQTQVQGTYILVACVTLGPYPGVIGSGTLFSIDFLVRDSGASNLTLSETILLDSTLTEISHNTFDGAFHTTAPKAQFTYTTTQPTTGENVTFNASNSYDLDGTIVSYEWDFGDGTTGTDMVITHSYGTEGSYTVTLLVTDNDGLSDDATVTIHARAPLLAYVSVPYHRQVSSYYCGPAALEMVFDFYGPDIPQGEIADVARTAPDGTYTCDMVRASHFSNLSTFPIGGYPTTGYTARKLGYAAFECWDMTIDELKSLIAAGYPIIVLTTWHYRVAVGYSITRITFQDPYYGQNLSMTYEAFASDWDYSSHWGLFINPWKIEVSIPSNVFLGSVFNITANITYPAPSPFFTDQYPASLPNATVTLPAGLSLIAGETEKKRVSTGDLTPGTSACVTWTARADNPGTYTISVEADGKVAGSVPPIPSYPEPYDYEDRIGGFNQSAVDVLPTPPSPVENIQELIETIATWSLSRGAKNSLISKLVGALHLLGMENENGAVHKLMIFLKKVEVSRGKKLADEQADYLIREAQRIIDLIQG